MSKIMDISNLDADELLLSWGWTGFYQLFVAFCCSSVWVFLAFQSMSWAFIGLHHPFTCVFFNETVNTTTLSYDKMCHVPGDNNTKCATPGSNTSFVYDPSFGVTLTSEYELICDRYVLAQMGTTLFTSALTGSAISCGLLGDIPVAQLADAYGRKWVFLACYMSSILITLIRVYVRRYWMDVVIYILLGATSCGVVSTGYVLACEMLTPNMRGVALSIMEGEIWVLGYVLQGLAVMVWPNWRDMVFYTNLPFLLSISFIWLIPESLHWLLAERQYAAADRWVRTMSRRNCKRYEQAVAVCERSTADIAAKAQPPRQQQVKRTICDILRSPVLMFHGLICAYNGVTAMVVYWGLSLFSTQMHDNRFVGYFLSGLIEIPAGLLGPLLLLKIGRKTLVLVAQLVTVVGFVLRFLCPDDAAAWLKLTTFLVAKWGNILIWPGTFLLQAEIFPTTVRTLGYGIMASFSTLGNMTAPFIGDLLVSAPALGCAVYVCMCLLSCVLTLALPETAGRDLPVDIDDGQQNLGPFLTWWRSRKDRPQQQQHEQQPDKDAIALLDK